MVKVAVLGASSPLRVIEASAGTLTVEQAVEKAGFDVDLDEYTVRIDGRVATYTTPVQEGSLVTLVPEIKGGN